MVKCIRGIICELANVLQILILLTSKPSWNEFEVVL